MSSQALYRKWRSQTFDELVGQEQIVQSLRNAIAAERIGHAYLFTGPRGVGKTSAARILSKAVNCEHPDARQRPCAQCSACISIAEGRAVDVIEMDAASHTSVEDAREIIERVQFRPAVLRKKVYVIDEVHMLSTAAFNALLKTLEEPPDHAMFILATTEMHKVPQTIASRCQCFSFNRHTIKKTSAHLQWVAAQEDVALDVDASEAIARAATGSMRDAMSILDQLIAYGQQHIALEQVRGLIGSAAAEEVQHLVTALGQQHVAEALRIINTVANHGSDLRQFTRDVVAHLRWLMLLKAGGDPASLDASIDLLQVLQEQTAQLELASLLHWLKVFSGLDHVLRTTPYGQLPLEMAVVESLAVPVAEPAPRAALPPRPTMLERRPAPEATRPPVEPAREPGSPPAPQSEAERPRSEAPAAPRAATPAAPPERSAPPPAQAPAGPPPAEQREGALSDAEITLGEIEAMWNQIIEEMRPYSPSLQALLRGCEPVRMEHENTLVLGAASPFHATKIEEPNNRRMLEMVIERVTGKLLAVHSEHLKQEDRTRLSDERKRREELMKDDYIRFARNIFGARIIGIEEGDGPHPND